MRASDPSDFAITLGRYELLEGIESDAVSELWLARSTEEPDRVLRLLRLRGGAAEDGESREGFLGFMRKAASRRSPLLLRVLAVGAEGDSVYAVVEHVEGMDLEGLLAMARDDGAPLPTGVALRVVLDVIAALEALGGPHGDLTPQGIHVTAGGVTVLSPVSVAVPACRAPREGALRRLAYKAPEQLADEKKAAGSARADVFALGAILFEALAGYPLVRGTDGDDIAGAMASALPPAEELPAKLEKVVLKALARDPSGRYATPADLGEALEKAAPALVADRHQIASAFWHLAGNDLAARRFELESLMQGATEVAVEEARRSSEFPPARPAEDAAEDANDEPAGAGQAVDEAASHEAAAADEGDDDEAEASAEADDDEAEASAEADDDEAEASAEADDDEAAEAEPAEEEPEPRAVARARRGAGRERAGAERDEPPMVHQRSIPPERSAQTRKVVTGVVIGAAALLVLGLIVRSGHRSDAPSAAPDTAATHASPPAKAQQVEPTLPATQNDPATQAPPTTAPPATAAAPEPAPAASEPAAETAAAPPPPAHKKKHKHHAKKAPPPAKTAAPPATASAPAQHVASFGAVPSTQPAPPVPTAKPKPPSTSAVPVPDAPF